MSDYRTDPMPIDRILETSKTGVLDYDRLTHSAGAISLAGWSLLRLSGADAKEWLQGQVTNDVRRLSEDSPLSFCLCTNTGQVEAVVDAWELEGALYLSCEKKVVQTFLSRVEDTVIIEDVVVEDLSSTMQGVSIQGLAAADVVAGIENALVFPSRRSIFGGFDLWRSDELNIKVEEISGELAEILRLEAGIPRAGLDYDSKTLAPELGRVFEARHISYTKGCYTGQEILMRIHSRGHTNKSWVGLLCEGEVERGAQVLGPNLESIGRITSSAVSPALGNIATAIVRNEFAEEDRQLLVNRGEAGQVLAVVRTLPFLPFA